jgi:hypothetical protein
MIMRIVLLCLFLTACYSMPEGTAKCNAEYRQVYEANATDHFWALRYAHDAFDRCMSGK